MRGFIVSVLTILSVSACSQAILDSCFQSAPYGTSFQSSPTLGNSPNADLLQWNGSSWSGSWPTANVNLEPPCDEINTRAIWIGDQTFWTTDGEGFAVKLDQSLISGTTYYFTFTYASNGSFSNGNFSPYFKTNISSDYVTSHSVGQLTPAGYNWETHTFSFTASAIQNGDIWILIHSNDGSGIVLNFCQTTVQIDLGADTVICFGDSMSLSANAGFTTYAWNTGDTTAFITVTSPGTYIVTVSSALCSATDTIEIGYILCNVPQTAFESNTTALCEKFCIDFMDQTTNYPTVWQWMFPGGAPSSSADQNPINICYNAAGMYDVTLITTNVNGNDTLTLYNYITVYPTPPFPTITQVGYTLTSSPASSYQWQLNSVDIPGATNQSHTVLQTGYYTVIAGDLNGCKNSFTTYVLISGIADVSADANFSIYPNPSSGSFIVEWLNGQMAGDVSIDVVNTLGQKIFSSAKKNSISDFRIQIDLSDVARGIYFADIKSENGFVHKKILIIE